MFGMGMGELLVIAVVILVVVGPKRLPSMMRTVGKTMGELRRAAMDVRQSIGIDEIMRDDNFRQPSRPALKAPVTDVIRQERNEDTLSDFQTEDATTISEAALEQAPADDHHDSSQHAATLADTDTAGSTDAEMNPFGSDQIETGQFDVDAVTVAGQVRTEISDTLAEVSAPKDAQSEKETEA